MKFKLILMGLLFILSSGSLAADRQWSEEFNFFLMEIDEQVLQKNDMELQSISHDFPSHLAVLMGKKLKEQERHVGRNPAYKQKRQKLINEIKPWFSMIVESIGSVEPFTGKRVTADSLFQVVEDAYNGKFDKYVRQEYGFSSFPEGPSIYAMADRFRSRDKKGSDSTFALFEQDDEPKEISLLGVGASKDLKTSHDAYNAGIDAWNASLKLWFAGNAGASKNKVIEAQEYFNLAEEMGMVIVLEAWEYIEVDDWLKRPAGPCHHSRYINCKDESRSKAYMSHRK